MKKLLGILVLGLVLSVNAYGRDDTARELFLECKLGIKLLDEGKDSVSDLEMAKALQCITFIKGIMEAASFQHLIDKGLAKDLPYNILNSCPPGEGQMAFAQIMRIFVKFLKDHPEYMHRDYIEVIGKSLAYNFPCNN